MHKEKQVSLVNQDGLSQAREVLPGHLDLKDRLVAWAGQDLQDHQGHLVREEWLVKLVV